MTQPSGDEPATTFDPGRSRPADDEITILDPGRHRPGLGGSGELPPELDRRFVVQELLGRPNAPDQVLHVRERTTDDPYVIKLYGAQPPEARVWTYLTGPHVPQVVRVLEVGTADGISYELMEYIAGTPARLRAERPDGFRPDEIEALVRGAVQALTDVHAHGIVHRDVKPSNMRMRDNDLRNLVLVDFGIASVTSRSITVADQSGTTRFMPPEFMSARRVSPAYDWWSLGITLVELISGRPVLHGLRDDLVRERYAQGPLDLSAVTDQYVRMLCQGLLAMNAAERWGAEQVNAWLDHNPPPLPPSSGYQPAETVPEVTEAFEFLGESYRRRDRLAARFSHSHGPAAELLFGTDPALMDDLVRWMAQYPDLHRFNPRGRGNLPGRVRLLHLIRRLAPEQPPLYRGFNISLQTLPDYARTALAGSDPQLLSLVNDLRTHELLPLLDAAPAPPELPDVGSGDGLADLHHRWVAEHDRWRDLVETLPIDIQDELRPRDPGEREREQNRIHAYCLYAALADDEVRFSLGQLVRQTARESGVDWYTRLAERRDGVFVAHRLRTVARERAIRRDERAQYRAVIEWSRRQNRPLALGWAVAGVTLLGILFVLFTGASDITPVASNATIVDAWLMAAAALGLTLALEALLAWQIGGRYHPEYSLMGAGLITLGRAARSVRRRNLSLVVVVAVLGVGYAIAVFVPQVIPPIVAVGVAVWACARYMRWLGDHEREEAEAQARNRAVANQAANEPAPVRQVLV
jgi:serine/threonine protein kinase